MRIESVDLHEIGPFRDAHFDFQTAPSSNGSEVHVFIGPNGCGKSTILHSIAACLTPNNIGQDTTTRRMWNDQSYVEAEVDRVRAKVMKRGTFPKDFYEQHHPLEGGRILQTGGKLDRTFSSAPQWLKVSHALVLGGGTFRQYPHGFLPAFAYAGTRTIDHHEVKSFGAPPPENWLDNSLDFERKNQSQVFAQWLAISFTQEALATKQGHLEAASKFTQAISEVTKTLGELLGRPISIKMEYEPLGITLDEGGRSVPLDLLPEGLKSILSWLGDLMIRLERTPWPEREAVTKRSFILLLDEVDIHLHPAWQWKILPLIRKLFPFAQIFISTHSPFVVSSVDGIWIHPLRIDENREVRLGEVIHAQSGLGLLGVIRDIFGVEQQFDDSTQAQLSQFYEEKRKVLGERKKTATFEELVLSLAAKGDEVRNIILAEVAQIDRAIR